MWSIMNPNPMGHHHGRMGPLTTTQKREYSLNVNTVPIVPGKTFYNPNFVISKNPPVHTPVSKPLETNRSALIGSSQSLVDTIKQHHLDTVKTTKPESNSKMCTKRCRRNRRNNRKNPSKNSKRSDTRNQIKDMMEVEVADVDKSEIYRPPVLSTTFNLTDFIVNKPAEVAVDSDSESEVEFTAVISVSPSFSTPYVRHRQLSVSSDDSFIMFEQGTDGESSDEESESDTDDEWDEEDDSDDQVEGEDEVDFIRPSCPVVIPSKKVRFADDGDLCVVHKMVQWSFAYQKARKGPWEEYARDRDRFNRRIFDAERMLRPVLDAAHRDKVYQQRFQCDGITN